MEAIVAVYSDWGIGDGITQPVTLKADRQHFREVTRDAAVIVGRKTLEDFPGGRPLKGRVNIVVTRQQITIPGAFVACSPEAALQLAEKSGREQSCVSALAMAPEHTKDKLVEALAMGADEAYLLSDKAFGGADTYATSRTLAQAVRKLEEEKGFVFDLILAGTSSSDGGTSHVAVQTAEWLKRTHISNVCSLELKDFFFPAEPEDPNDRPAP